MTNTLALVLIALAVMVTAAPLPTCFGVTNLVTHVCSNVGICKSTDNCECLVKGYYGPNCQYYDCFNIQNTNKNFTCSGNGYCAGPDTCFCKYGFKGDRCDIINTCYGIRFNDTLNVCSGNGVCGEDGKCYCTNGSQEQNCSAPFNCHGTSSLAPWVCSGSDHGTCFSKDTCQCNDGYSGSQCELFTCNSVLYNNTQTVCSGKGVCYGPDLCFCNEGYAGANCELLATATPASSSRRLGINSFLAHSSSTRSQLTVSVSMTILLLYVAMHIL
jgi:hypothetical protein